MVVAGPCAICNQQGRYACPRCSKVSCSLDCANAHKRDDACSGERDRVAYVPMSSYGPGTLLDDFRFLEDVSRRVSDWGKGIVDPKLGGSRGPGRGRGRGRGGREVVQLGRHAPLPPAVAKLRRCAAERGLEIVFLSEGMARRKANKSFWQQSLQLDLTLVLRLNAGHQPRPSALPYMQLRKTDTRRSLIETVRARLADSTGSLPSTTQADLRTAAALADGLAFIMRVPQVLQAQQMSPPAAPQPSPVVFPTLNGPMPVRPGVASGSSAHAWAAPRPPLSTDGNPAAVWLLPADVPLIEALNGCTCVEWPDVEVWTKPALEQALREGRLDVRVQVARAVAAPTKPKPLKPLVGEKRKRDDEAASALVGYDSAGEDEGGEDAADAGVVDGGEGPRDIGLEESDAEGGAFVDDMAIAAAAAGDLFALAQDS